MPTQTAAVTDRSTFIVGVDQVFGCKYHIHTMKLSVPPWFYGWLIFVYMLEDWATLDGAALIAFVMGDGTMDEHHHPGWFASGPVPCFCGSW